MEQNEKFTKPWKVATIVALVFAILAFVLAVIPFANYASTNMKTNFLISKKYDKGQTLEKALETKKPVVLFFYVDWCRYCKALAPQFNKVVKKKSFVKIFAPAYINCEDPNNEELVKQYDIKGYPSLFLIKENGSKTQLSPEVFFSEDPIKSIQEAE